MRTASRETDEAGRACYIDTRAYFHKKETL